MLLKDNYKKIIDKEYKKSLDLDDNKQKFNIFYKIENADKVLEDKIEVLLVCFIGYWFIII